MWKFSRMTSWNASRCRVGGNPSSGPAMSKPTTPASRWRTASSAISVEWACWRMAESRPRMTMGRSRLPVGEAGDHGVDHLVERQAAGQVQLGREADLGVDDAVGGEVLGALGGHPGRWPRRVCITPTVCWNVSRYFSSE